MKTIWKFPLEVTDFQTIRMPKDAEILSVADQYGVVCVWAKVDSENELEDRTFYIAGTGNLFDDSWNWQFVGSVQQSVFVWHVFVEVK
jgi:hypothetical protein